MNRKAQSAKRIELGFNALLYAPCFIIQCCACDTHESIIYRGDTI